MAEWLTHIITGGLGPLIFLVGYHTQSNKNRKGRKAKKERPILPEEKTCLPSHPEFQSALKDLCKNQMRNRSLHLWHIWSQVGRKQSSILQVVNTMHQRGHNITLLTEQMEQIKILPFSDRSSKLSPLKRADWLWLGLKILVCALIGLWVLGMIYHWLHIQTL